MTPRSTVAIAVVGALLSVACGGTTPKAEKGAARSVQIDMVDSSYQPAAVQVAKGETVTFTFSNKGKAAHDAFIGSAAEQAEHEKSMRSADGGHGGGHGDDKKSISVEPGKSGQLTHTFTDAGSVEIGCHEPGHYAAGMKLAVTAA